MSLDINKVFDSEKNLWEVKLIGEIDISTASILKATLIKLLEDKQADIKLDCKELQYIDSTGLGVLIGILKRLKSIDKNIIITNPKLNISKLFRITGLDKIFVIE